MTPVMRGNLFAGDDPSHGERFDAIARVRGTTIECIASAASAEGPAYDQDHDEWVVLLRGHAVLAIGDERVELGAGDWLLLPAHTPHRVLETSAGTRWLAVHVA